MKKRLKKILILAVFPIVLFLTLGIVSFGAILGNVVAAPQNGGAIIVGNGSKFNMKSGSISGFNATNGGGVYISAGGTFNINGGAIYGNTATSSGNNIYNVGTFTMNGGSVGTSGSSSSGYGVYNIGTMNLYGGNVYDNVYSSANINTKMACNVAGTITLGNSATITLRDYAGTTPNYAINLSNTRTAGTILTFVGSSTEPDLTKLNISGYNSEECRLSVAKNSSGNWTVSLVNIAIDFPKNWKTEVASSTYMTTTVTPANITKIQFVATVPSGYTKIGTLSTGLSVYQGTTATDIAFVCEKIYAPKDSRYLFDELKKVTSFKFDTFNTSKATNMYGAFRWGESLQSLDLSNFNTSNVTNMGDMFYRCESLTSLNVSNFNTSKVTNMDHMFYNCLSLTSLNLSNFNTSNVTDMSYMFQAFLVDSALTSLDVSNFDTSKVTNMVQMFQKCKVLTNIDVSNFNTSNVTNLSAMFQGCNALTSLNVSSFNTSKVTNMNHMFSICSGLTSLNLSNFDMSKVTNMSNMFSYCKALTSLDVSSFDTSNVTNMESMFEYCNALTSLDVSNFDTSNVTNMKFMFSSCDKLTSLNLSNFNTSNVTNMYAMFQSCYALTNIDVSNFNTSNVTNMSYMFSGCSELTSLNLSSFDMTNAETYDRMLNFSGYGTVNLKLLKTPYNNTSDIPISAYGVTLYNVETGAVVTSVPAGTTRSLTYSSTRPSSFVSNNKIYKFETCFVEIETPVENEFDEAVNESKNCFVLNNKRKFQFKIVKVEV